MDKPNIIEHVHKPLDYTLFDARWIPCSPRFVVLGNYPRGTGALQIYEVSKGSVNLLKNVSKSLDMLHNLKYRSCSPISRDPKLFHISSC